MTVPGETGPGAAATLVADARLFLLASTVLPRGAVWEPGKCPPSLNPIRLNTPKTTTANATTIGRRERGGSESVDGITWFRRNGSAAIFVLRIKAHAREKVNAFLSINLWKPRQG